MPSLAEERDIVRGLAAKLAEVAALPVQQEKAELWRRLNRLDPIRPAVWLRMPEDAPWRETGLDDTLQCADPSLRRQEQLLKRQLYQSEHQQADLVLDGVIHSPVVVHTTGWGLEAKHEDPDHWFGSHRFVPVMVAEEDIEKIRIPEVTVDWEETDRQYQRLCDLYGGVLPVQKTGVREFWFHNFDDFITWRGVDQAFMDMLDRPEWVHRVMRRMNDGELARIESLERQGALALNNGNVRVGSAGLCITDELPQPDFDGTHVRLRDLWGHAATQIFVDVSPAMHEEFALQYEGELLSHFGLAGYGCCEPLHHKVDIARKHIPHLRRISMSPWVDVEAGAAAVGDDLIFSYRPNPAIMAGDTWDPQQVKADLRRVLETTRAHGCPVEILMKDLHTCNGHPERMWDWTRVAVEVAEEFAY
jgi:hypothetical protein